MSQVSQPSRHCRAAYIAVQITKMRDAEVVEGGGERGKTRQITAELDPSGIAAIGIPRLGVHRPLCRGRGRGSVIVNPPLLRASDGIAILMFGQSRLGLGASRALFLLHSQRGMKDDADRVAHAGSDAADDVP
jgi:hypothetical protein